MAAAAFLQALRHQGLCRFALLRIKRQRGRSLPVKPSSSPPLGIDHPEFARLGIAQKHQGSCAAFKLLA
ncbi:MAG: hypothetical protein EBX54_08730 [Betaproteobacteria bacterium]|nr:hypothetical protein [Betaproteobacteria bacterium]